MLASDQALLQEILAEVRHLRKENAALRKENAALKKENKRLREENARLYALLVEKDERVAELEGEVALLKQELYGKKTEKEKQDQSDEANEDSDEKGKDSNSSKADHNKDSSSQDTKDTTSEKPNRRPKRKDYSHLPLNVVISDVQDEEKVCSHCGMPFRPFIDLYESETIEVDVRAHRRKLCRKRYIRRCNCPGTPRILSGPSFGKVVPSGIYGVSLWVKLLLDKFSNFLPIERVIKDMNRLGLSLSRSTINDGMKKLHGVFKPIYEAIQMRNRSEEHWYADETRWYVYEKMEGKASTKWMLWVFHSPTTVFYRIDPSRSARVLKEHLGDVDGIISCDRFSAYKGFANQSKGGIDLAYCWAHMRRDFLKVGIANADLKNWSDEVVREIGNLYHLHHLRRKAVGKKEYKKLHEQLISTMLAFRDARKNELTQGCPSAQAKVNQSLLEHWHGLTVVFANPVIDMDNNQAERDLRGPVLGRKNYWGSITRWSAELAAMMFTILATLGLWSLNGKIWLTNLLELYACHNGLSSDQIADFLPWNFSADRLERFALKPINPGTDPP